MARLPNPWKGLAGLPRQAWVLFASTLVNRCGTMALPFLVLYLVRDLGFPAGRAGLVMTVYGAFALVAAPLSGRLCDRLGHLRVMKASLFSSGVVMLLFPLARTWAWVLAATVVFSLTTESYRPASLAVLADLVPADRRKAIFALNRLAINLGMSVGPAVGGFLATRSFGALFAVDGTTTLLAGAVLALFGSSAPRRPHLEPLHAGTVSGPPVASRPAHRDARFLLFLATVLPVTMVFFQHVSSMALYLVHDLSLPASLYGLLFTVNTVLIVLLEVQINTSTAHWHPGRTLALGSLLVGTGFGSLALARGAWSATATVIVWTFGEMILLPGMSAYAADLAPADRRGEYMGYYSMAFGVAFALGPWLGTEVLARYGGAVLWPATLAFGVVSALAMLRLPSPRPEPTVR